MKPILSHTSETWGDSYDDYKLSTGKELSANRGIIGIDPLLNISEGYDGEIDDDYLLTKEEKIEVADYMISLWEKYKEKAKE